MGTLTLDTELNKSGFERGYKQAEAATKRFADRVASDIGGIGKSFDKTAAKIETLTQRLARQSETVDRQKSKVAELRAEYEKLVSGEVEPKSLKAMEQEFARNQKEAEKLEKAIADLNYRLERSPAAVGFATPETAGMQTELTALRERLAELDAESDKLGASMEKIRLDPATSAEAQKLSGEIELANQKMERLTNEAVTTETQMKRAMSEKPVKKLNDELKQTPSMADAAGIAIEKFGNRIKRLVSAVFVFNIIRQALTVLRNYIGKLLSTNDQFVSSLTSIKENLMAAFQPIYEAVLPAITALMNVLAKVTYYLAAFINMLFGKTVAQSKAAAKALNAEADALDNVGAAAAGASKDLATFDEINKLQGSGGGAAAVESIADEISEIDESDFSWLDKVGVLFDNLSLKLGNLQEAFAEAWAKIKEFFTNLGTVKLPEWVLTGITIPAPVFEKLKIPDWVGASLPSPEFVPDPILAPDVSIEPLEQGLAQVETALDDMNTNVVPNWAERFAEAFSRTLDTVKGYFTAFPGTVTPALQTVFTYINTATPIALRNMVESFRTGLQNISDNVSTWGTNVMQNMHDVMGYIGKVTATGLTSAAENFVDWVKNTSGNFAAWGNNLVTNVGITMKGWWETFTSALSSAWESFTGFMKGIGEAISTWWSGNKQWVIPVAIGVAAVAGITAVALTGGAALPAVAGLASAGLATVPALATGTVVPPNKEFLAILGDNTQEHEIVTPRSMMAETFEDVLDRRGADAGGGGDLVFQLILDGRQVGEGILPWTEVAKARRGGSFSNRLVIT